MKDTASARALFQHALPEDRLGQEHASLPAFRKATNHFAAESAKEYTLIIVTGSSNNRRILLGQKHRGFGKGFYNSFGGKVEPGEDIAVGAARELEEETGIPVSVNDMENSQLGTLYFTFEDSSVEMVVHVFRVRVTFDEKETLEDLRVIHLATPSIIRGCEEITPIWFEDWTDIPLHTMFADDTVWLTNVLASSESLLLDAWFHFRAGGQNTNTILHYFLDLKETGNDANSKTAADRSSNGEQTTEKQKHTLERRLFHALHSVNSPSFKEFNESFAYVNAVRSAFGKSNSQRNNAFDFVIDVAGGHGALAALFLLTTSARVGTVIDPARVGQIQGAWGDFLKDKSLRFRHECLRTGLPSELALAMEHTVPDRILVVACHACQHLSDEVLEISCRHGVNVAVMPCCQRDPSPGYAWKLASERLEIPIEKTMDLLLAGKCMSWTTGAAANVTYDVRMKFVDAKITPQNRIIVCRVLSGDNKNIRGEGIAKAHHKLEVAYRKAHANILQSACKTATPLMQDFRFIAGTGFGILLAFAFTRR